jgi:hypothetical protein
MGKPGKCAKSARLAMVGEGGKGRESVGKGGNGREWRELGRKLVGVEIPGRRGVGDV